MAAKKDSVNLTHSQIHGGDFVFDFCCTPCDKRKYNRKATKYCVNCSEYYCVKCVENHKDFKALSGHVLVDPNTVTPALSRSGTSHLAAPTELCKRHHLKLVDMYCAEEDIVGCSACFLLDHKSCSDIHYIPEYIQSSFPTGQVDQINRKLTNAIKDMGKLKIKHHNLNENLDKSKANCKQEIQKYRNDINQIFDQIEETTLAELDARHKDTRKKTDDTNQNIHDLQNEMVRLKSEIESDQSNDCQKFVSAKLSQCAITQGEELHSELSHDQTTELKFTRNTDIMTFLLSFVTLGMLSSPVLQDVASSTDSDSGKQPQQIKCTTKSPTKSTRSPSASGDNSENKPVSTRQETAAVIKPQKQGLYKMVDKSEYNLHQPDDRHTCDIYSPCIIDSDNILFADYFNNKIKLVDSKTYTIRSSLALDACPWSVCRVSSKEAVVCLDNDSIEFVSIKRDKLKPIRSLSMKHGCSCIDVIRDKMYVCDYTSVYIHTLNGKLVQTISKDKSGNAIFSFIWDITVSDDEQMIHVADKDNGVITLDTDGNVVWRYSGRELSGTRGVCTDGNGHVIACGFGSNNVIQLSADGKYMGEIVTHSDGVMHPQTVSYDSHKHKLIIGKCLSNTITVYTIQ